MVVARAGLSALLALQPDALRRLGEVTLDWRVLAFTCGLALVGGALFALAPLREYARGDVTAALASARGEAPRLRPRARSAPGDRSGGAHPGAPDRRRLAGADLRADPGDRSGFSAAGVLSFRVPSATPRYPTPVARDALERTLRTALRALPSVTSVGATSHLPYDTIPNWGGPYSLVEATDEALPSADYRSVGPGLPRPPVSSC